MKTKIVFLSLVVNMLMSLSLLASVEHLNLEGIQSGSVFYYCSLDVDSVIVHKPDGSGWCEFAGPGMGWTTVDSVIITVNNSGLWYWSNGVEIGFYINFTSTSPSEPFTAAELYKCPETSLVIPGQAEHHPDFTYVWGGGETSPSIQLQTPGAVFVTVTGVCGEVTDYMEVINWPSPHPDLGADQLLCNGSTATLDPGAFTAYFWTGGSTDPTLGVTTTGTYTVTVADDNGCQETDEIFVEFTTNPGQEILLVTIDTVDGPTKGNNMILWENLSSAYEYTRIYRGAELVATVPYADEAYIDEVNSVSQTWQYRIEIIDTCGNVSAISLYHQTIKTVTNYAIGGLDIVWTSYEIEGVEKANAVTSYHIFAISGSSIEEIHSAEFYVNSYFVANPDDSMFVVGAELASDTKSGLSELALSNFVNNPLLGVPSILAEDIKIYPNPSTGVFFVEGGDRVEIYNSAGQLVMSKSVDQLTSIEITAGAGLYIVKVYDRTQVIVSNKISIQ